MQARARERKLMDRDTICAISTPHGVSGIGIIRLSGDRTCRVIGRIFKPKKKTDINKADSHTVMYGHIMDASGKLVEEVLVTLMKKPRSYTREDMAEIGCHGGLIPMKAVLNACIDSGARLAEPGEFTKRAFINGRIDLAQAESVMEVINSRTERGLHVSLKKLRGKLSKPLAETRKSLLETLSAIEAKINFPEEEDVKNYDADMEASVRRMLDFTGDLIKKSDRGKIVYGGVNAAIVGKTNAGKSSLLNALAREDRAIVTEVAGTTRDAIQETINIKGIPVTIIDTAGIRKARGKIEKMGLEKSLEWMGKADINLVVLDSAKKLNGYDRQILKKAKEKKHLLIINKTDLPMKIELMYLHGIAGKDRIVLISAVTGKGIDELEEKIYSLVNEGRTEIKGDEIFLNMRQEGKIKDIHRQLSLIITDRLMKHNMEIAAEQVKRCIKDIDELTGKDINEDVLKDIFSRFCIGK